MRRVPGLWRSGGSQALAAVGVVGASSVGARAKTAPVALRGVPRNGNSKSVSIGGLSPASWQDCPGGVAGGVP